MTPEEKRAHWDAVADHRTVVLANMKVLTTALTNAAVDHDTSKFQEPECSVFAETTAKLRGLTYGSDEYHQALKDLGPALDHHYKANRHHPEHNDIGIAGMDLVDIVEMFCDWLASTKRHADGDMEKSIEHNRDRFVMDPQLVKIFQNTYRRHFKDA